LTIARIRPLGIAPKMGHARTEASGTIPVFKLIMADETYFFDPRQQRAESKKLLALSIE
tara:strand:+ start:46 stop:222 length:177 start_codon:yes stop_codon:yes gene_type:complete